MPKIVKFATKEYTYVDNKKNQDLNRVGQKYTKKVIQGCIQQKGGNRGTEAPTVTAEKAKALFDKAEKYYN